MRINRGLQALVLLTMAGCQAAPPSGNQSTRTTAAPPATAAPAKASPSPAAAAQDKAVGGVAAYINGQPVPWSALHAPLIELAGGEVFTEHVLDRMTARRLSERGLTVSDAQVTAEADMMRHALHADAAQAQRLLDELRRRRGLGPARWDHMLRRSAGLRALIQSDVNVTDDAIRQAYDVRYGPRYTVRLIVVESAQEASRVMREAQGGASFIDLAIANSTDSSRAQGGMLEPISPADPTWPQALRESVVKLGVGEISTPIALDKGFAILKLEGKTEAQSIRIDDVKDKLAGQVRMDIETVLMRRLAKTMLDEADIVILDPGLKRRYEEHNQP